MSINNKAYTLNGLIYIPYMQQNMAALLLEYAADINQGDELGQHNITPMQFISDTDDVRWMVVKISTCIKGQNHAICDNKAMLDMYVSYINLNS